MKRVLVLLAVSGCAFGGSSSMVGRWKARRIVDSTACLQSQAPGAGSGCQKLITIGRDLPERKFRTMVLTVSALGYVQQRGKGSTDHGVLDDNHLEYLVGKGGFAWGARLGATFTGALGEGLYFMMPVSAVAYLGGLWGSVYVGAGYSPIAMDQQYEMGIAVGDARYHHDSVHAFVGTRFWLRRDLERGLTFDPEIKVQRFGGTTLISATYNIGLHF